MGKGHKSKANGGKYRTQTVAAQSHDISSLTQSSSSSSSSSLPHFVSEGTPMVNPSNPESYLSFVPTAKQLAQPNPTLQLGQISSHLAPVHHDAQKSMSLAQPQMSKAWAVYGGINSWKANPKQGPVIPVHNFVKSEEEQKLANSMDDDDMPENDAAAAATSVSLSRTPSKSPAASGSNEEAKTQTTPSRVAVTGATWKSPGKNEKVSNVHNKVKTMSTSWALKEERRKALAESKARVRALQESARSTRAEERRKAEQRKQQRAANEQKNQIVQVIKDTSKIKRMKKKQLQYIKKMDTSSLKSSTVSLGSL